MSAYVVDREHIRYLVAAASRRRCSLSWYWGETDTCYVCNSEKKGKREWFKMFDRKESHIGQMLWDENIKSVLGRYPNDTEDSMPGPMGEDFLYDHKRLVGNFDPVQIIKACDCYIYQSCEHKEWKQSEAYTFIQALRESAIRALPGYDDAEWGAPKLDETIGII